MKGNVFPIRLREPEGAPAPRPPPDPALHSCQSCRGGPCSKGPFSFPHSSENIREHLESLVGLQALPRASCCPAAAQQSNGLNAQPLPPPGLGLHLLWQCDQETLAPDGRPQVLKLFSTYTFFNRWKKKNFFLMPKPNPGRNVQC